MAAESLQKWRGRNRPPRVQITYDLETRGAIEKKELPLVVGILAPLFGAAHAAANESVGDFKVRKFIEIDRDNFDEVLRTIAPKVKVEGEEITFEKIDDFHPDRLVERVPSLRELLDRRWNLTDLLARVDSDDALATELFEAVMNPDQLQKELEVE